MYCTTKHQAKEQLVTLLANGLGQMYWNLTLGSGSRIDMSPIHLETLGWVRISHCPTAGRRPPFSWTWAGFGSLIKELKAHLIP